MFEEWCVHRQFAFLLLPRCTFTVTTDWSTTPPPLKFQLSVLAKKLRIWSDSSTFSTLPLHTTLCVSTVLSLYTLFMFFVFNWDTVWITLFCLTDDIEVSVFKFGLLVTAVQLIQFKFCSFDFFGAFGILNPHSRILRFHLNWSWFKLLLLQWTSSLYSIHYT